MYVLNRMLSSVDELDLGKSVAGVAMLVEEGFNGPVKNFERRTIGWDSLEAMRIKPIKIIFGDRSDGSILPIDAEVDIEEVVNDWGKCDENVWSAFFQNCGWDFVKKH